MSWVSKNKKGITAGLTGGASLLPDLLGGGGSNTVSQVPLLTQEQIDAQKMLMNFAKTGKYGNYTAGEGYTGSLGDFNTTGTENLATGKLNDLLSSTLPEIYSQGQNTLSDFLTTDKYNPMANGGVYDAYKGTVQRQITDAENATKRSAAFGRNLYSGDTIRKLGDVQAKGQEALSSKLADMYQTYVGQKLQATPLALQAGQGAESMAQNRIAAGYQYGGLQRTLANQESSAKYNEWLRQRQDALTPLSSASSVMGTPVQWGVPSVTTQNPSGFENILNLISKVGPTMAAFA